MSECLAFEMALDASNGPVQIMVDAEGHPNDLRAAGVANAYTAFDNAASTGMGGTNKTPNRGGVLKVLKGSELLAGACSFTLQGWFKADSGETPGNFARLFTSARVSSYFDSKDGKGLVIAVNGDNVLCRDPAFQVSGEWVFFAVTYDGDQEEQNVNFYAGLENQPVALMSNASMSSGCVSNEQALQPIYIGNLSKRDRPFDGLIDHVRLWVTQEGSSAVLTLSELEEVRRSDLK
ncbi:LamG-like jellyroll fold domain-containing protein [Cerasicoccus frondis]|uniref:LamG-like jellyroll fold domain-containing protein n=1 Tax=Cerasicoccus frondis TaxID=490090 RepID=UPI0028529E34|nr:LamG-like jellyroll fold domain-containing protein [Cerasicoccus frondis]